MNKYELRATRENLTNTFKNNTLLRNADVIYFVDILNNLDESYSIALDGDWGSGKTFFVKQAKLVLEAHNNFTNNLKEDEKLVFNQNDKDYRPQVCVYYDAWENDNDVDPILSLVYSIIKSINKNYNIKRPKDCIDKAASFLEVFSGRNITNLIETLRGENPLEIISESKDVEVSIKEFLDAIIPEVGDRLVVFIDELDRCKPIYAVKLLERIKHYFDNEKITFVFSININQIQHTIKKYYGDSFNASRYLDRFFDLRISLPPVEMEKYYQSIGFSKTSYYFDKVCRKVIEVNNFSIREAAKFIKLAQIAAYKPTHDSGNSFLFDDGRAISFGLQFIVPIMLGLKIHDFEKYNSFIKGADSTPLYDIASELGEHYFNRLLSNSETFNNENGLTHVTIEEKLDLVYNALFKHNYDNDGYDVRIGDFVFTKYAQNEIIKATTLLSRYADYEID